MNFMNAPLEKKILILINELNSKLNNFIFAQPNAEVILPTILAPQNKISSCPPVNPVRLVCYVLKSLFQV